MGDQSLYKANHVVNCTESSYYQLPPTSVAAGAGGLNHSYGSTVMETPQASPVSSAFPHDTGKNYPELIETTKTGGSWPSAGNHLRNSLGNAGVMWAASGQGEALPAAEGAPYQYSCTQQAEGPAKLDPAVQKLDSFTQAGQAYGPQEQGHVGQHVQMSPAQSQYFYQEQPPQYCHVYQQSVHLQQAQQQAQQTPVQEELHSPTKHFQAESSCATVVSEVRDSSVNQKGTHPSMSAPSQTGQRALGEMLPTVQLVSIKSEIQEEQQPQQQQQPPAGTLWSQVMLNDMKPEATSPDDSTLASPTFLDRTEVKSKLVCAICFKEFKSLPALNGHMRSHGGMRASPSLKPLPDEIAPVPISFLHMLMPVSKSTVREEEERGTQEADSNASVGLPGPPTIYRVVFKLPAPSPRSLQVKSQMAQMSHSDCLKQEDGDKQLPKEVDAHLPIVMPVSVPVKLLPAAAMLRQPTDANQLAADHVDRSAQLPAPPGPPCQRPLGPPHGCSDAPRKLTKAEKPDKRGQHEKKKYKHRPEPLIIPPPSLTLSVGNATLFQSQLRSPRLLGEPPPYTPPPMLSPVRQGSGLFSSVIQHSQSTKAASPITPRVYLGRSSGADGLSVSVTPGLGEQLANIEPHINLGRQYQAEIPRLQSRSKMASDDHRASLVWTNRPEFESASGQQKVDNLVNMACSSVLPGGGTNSEYALHCLFETQGDFLATVEKLLMLKTTRQASHPLAGYHYAGSDQWTPLEKKMLKKALVIHNKDFFLVQKMVKTKTVSQCVEFYYTFKKRMHLGRKHRSRLMSAEEEEQLTNQNENTELDEVEEEKKSAQEEQQDTAMVDVSPDDRVTAPEEPAPVESAALANMSSFSFPCEMPNCGAVFTSRQALNGHGRIHGGTTQQVKLVLGSKMKVGSQSDYSSVKGSPAHSTTSGDTDPTLLFPCKECGKVFFKIKSRNAHMKTHKQQDDQEHKKVLHMPAMKLPSSLSQVSRHHVMLPLDHMGLVKRQGLDEEDEDPLLSSHLLLDDDHGGYLRDDDEL
ncbi:TREF1 factor, partial [Polypterus senegalus]|nr:TREF1 factor [Polypterus senegalus]